MMPLHTPDPTTLFKVITHPSNVSSKQMSQVGLAHYPGTAAGWRLRGAAGAKNLRFQSHYNTEAAKGTAGLHFHPHVTAASADHRPLEALRLLPLKCRAASGGVNNCNSATNCYSF